MRDPKPCLEPQPCWDSVTDELHRLRTSVRAVPAPAESRCARERATVEHSGSAHSRSGSPGPPTPWEARKVTYWLCADGTEQCSLFFWCSLRVPTGSPCVPLAVAMTGRDPTNGPASGNPSLKRLTSLVTQKDSAPYYGENLKTKIGSPRSIFGPSTFSSPLAKNGYVFGNFLQTSSTDFLHTARWLLMHRGRARHLPELHQ